MSERIMKALANCEQGLTEEQKLQARTNIGAIGGVYVHDAGGTNPLTPDANGYVTIDLTNAGKTQSDWDEENPVEPSFIRNKPDLSIYARRDEIEKGVFVGVYTGDEETTTPYSDYKEAWDDGKAVFLSYGIDDTSVILPLTAIDDVAAVFTRTMGEVSGNAYVNVSNFMVKVSAETDAYSFYTKALDSQEQANWTEQDPLAKSFIRNKPTLSEVAVSGSYNDLSDKPTIPAEQINSDWTEQDDSKKSFILHKPTVKPLVAGSNITITDGPSSVTISSQSAPQEQSDWAQTNSQAVSFIRNKPTLSEVAVTGSYNDLTDKPDIPGSQVNADWTEQDESKKSFILHKPNLAAVATTGSYNSLTDKPTIPAAQVQSSWTEADTSSKAYIQNKPNLASVATTGSYNSLTDKPTIPAAQVQADWAQTNSSAVDFVKNKPAAMETKPLVPGSNIEFNDVGSNTEISTSASKVIKRPYPYNVDIPLTAMIVNDPGEDFGSVIQDQGGNTLGFLAPKHYGNVDTGKVLTIVQDNGYKMEWRNPSGGSFDLKPLTIAEQHVTSTNPVQLTVVDGYAYEVINDVSGSLQVTLVTNSTDTVHSVLSFRNGSASQCSQMTIVWRDEALIQHQIVIDFTEADPGMVYNFDLYIKKVTISGTDYCIARLSDFPVYYRKAPYEFSTEYEGVGYVGLEM